MMCLSLEKWDNFIIDMDGVLWRGETPLSGLQEFFTALRGTKRNFVLATNNSNRTVNQYLKKLRRMGVQVSQEEILTSAQVTANHLANTAPNGSRVSVIGGDGLRTSLQEHDFEITDEKKNIISLYPEIRIYNQPNILTSEADIISTIFFDKFLVINLLKGEEIFNVRYQTKPFMIWIWISVCLISIGGMLSILKKN